MPTYNHQIQAIADVIGGHPPIIPLQELTEPFTWLLEWVQAAPSDQEYTILAGKKTENPELAEIIDAVFATAPGHRKIYKPVSHIETPPVKFLWESWIPRGELTLLVAAPGVGKTYVMLDLFRRLIHQQPSPDGSQFDVPDNVSKNIVLVDAENYLPAIKERVEAWGMDTNRLFPMEKPVRGLIDLSDITYQRELADMVEMLRPSLVAVDSLSRVNSRGENNIEDLREVLDFLAVLPGLYNCGLILVHHLRKRNARQTHKPVSIDDIRGSGDLIAAARSVIAIDPIQDNKNARKMRNIKINEGETPPALGFSLISLDHNPRIARLEYTSLSDLLPSPGPTKIEQCAEWLQVVLQDKPLSLRELSDLGVKMDYDLSTLQRARGSLEGRIKDTIAPRVVGNKWALNENVLR